MQVQIRRATQRAHTCRTASRRLAVCQIAILHEGDRPGDVRKITYGQMLSEVSRIANYFKSQGLVKGDTVAIYMPTIPEAVFTMLACARLGIVHR